MSRCDLCRRQIEDWNFKEFDRWIICLGCDATIEDEIEGRLNYDQE